MEVLSKDKIRCVSTKGITFVRRADGAVLIYVPESEGEKLHPKLLATIPANEWASIISSMTTSGEYGVTFCLAMAFHLQGCAYDNAAS